MIDLELDINDLKRFAEWYAFRDGIITSSSDDEDLYTKILQYIREVEL